jgi:DNA-binding transcriptional LysR family regulator
MLRAVAEERGFTRAGERLHVSQSAISRQIKLLEDELGTVLLHRRGAAFGLTHAGERLLEAARRIFREIDETVLQITEARELRRGTLRLGGGMTVCLYIFPQLIKKYRTLYPGVELRVTSGTAEAILKLIRSHEVDLGLLTLPILAKDLEMIPSLKEEMVVVTAAGHPLSRKRTVEPAEVARYPLIVFEPGSNTRKVVDEFFLAEQLPMDVAMETENVEIIKVMVASGIGVTLIPYSAVAHDPRRSRFSWARMRNRKLYRETGWVYLKTDALPRSVAEMLRLFREVREPFRAPPQS